MSVWTEIKGSYKGTKGEYHLLHLDSLVEKFESKNAQVKEYTYWNEP
jgi:hypothetical protein